jgi:hypothetical protein
MQTEKIGVRLKMILKELYSALKNTKKMLLKMLIIILNLFDLQIEDARNRTR